MTEPPVLELDVNDPEHLEALAADLQERWGSVDGILHAIAFAPQDALGGNFLETPAESAITAFQTSAFSLKALAVALLPLMERSERSPGHRGPRLRRGRRLAHLRLDGRREGGAGVGQPLPRARSRAQGRAQQPRGGRPAADDGGEEHRRLRPPRRLWNEQAPLHWDDRDAGPVADACLFLLSDAARAITGEVLHVDGGYHALGAPLQPSAEAS